MKRFALVLAVVGLAAAIFAGTAAALRFTDDDFIWADGEVGTQYFKQLGAAGGCTPYKFSVLAGEFPDGLTLASDGRVTGIPTRLGQWRFWLELRGAGCPSDGTAQREFTMSVTRLKVTVKTSTLPDAFKNAAYPTQTLQVIGGTGSGYTWSLSAGSLPAGLTLNANGTIAGTPTTNGTSIFVVRATDNAGKSDTKQLSITVVDPLTASLSPSVAEVGIPFSSTLKPVGGTPGYVLLASELPGGLSFDASTATITGTPEVAGVYRVAVKMTDAHGLAASAVVRLTVVRQLAIATRRLPAATVGVRLGVKLRLAGGARPFRWSASGLPGGLRVRGGTLAGVPSSPGTYHVRFSVRDALGATSIKMLTLVVH